MQQHFDNTQLLKNAVASGLITNEQYNQLSGYDTTQTMPGVFNIPGIKGLTQGLASSAYNVVQSAAGDQPWSQIPGDVWRNIQGAQGLSPELLSQYHQITGGSGGSQNNSWWAGHDDVDDDWKFGKKFNPRINLVNKPPVTNTNQGGGNQGGGNQGGGGQGGGGQGGGNQGGGGTGQSGRAVGGYTPPSSTPKGPDLRNRARGGIISLWRR